jgi:hypothetical protein
VQRTGKFIAISKTYNEGAAHRNIFKFMYYIAYILSQ